MKLSIVTFSIMAFNITTLRIETFIQTALSTALLSIKTLLVNVTFDGFLLNVIMLNVVAPFLEMSTGNRYKCYVAVSDFFC